MYVHVCTCIYVHVCTLYVCMYAQYIHLLAYILKSEMLHVCRRNLEFYDTCHYDAVQSCDSDCTPSAGELVIKISKACYDSMGAFGEFSLSLSLPPSLPPSLSPPLPLCQLSNSCSHAAVLEGKPLKVLIEFSLEQPKGGVQFVIPPSASTDNSVYNTLYVHVYTYMYL